MHRIRTGAAVFGLVLLSWVPRPAAGQDFLEGKNLLAGAVGGAMGVTAGGYITLSIVVAQARAGRYVTGLDDFLSWRSAPVLIGGGTGMVLGLIDEERLRSTTIFGLGGTAAGMLTGLVVGPAIWKVPEGRWAGAAIGAGIGMVAGCTYGFFRHLDDDSKDAGESAVRVPLVIRIPVR